MTSESWEQLPYLIIVDLGVCASAMPCNWCMHVPLIFTPQSEANGYFKAAKGETIYNEGQRMATMMAKEAAKSDEVHSVWSVERPRVRVTDGQSGPQSGTQYIRGPQRRIS